MNCPTCDEPLLGICVRDVEYNDTGTALIATHLAKCPICGSWYEWEDYFTLTNSANLREVKNSLKNA